MKRIIVLLFLMSACIYAQRETVFREEMESGGFGSPVIKFTQVKGSFGVLVGGYGGWLINHKFLIGGGGFGLANEINAQDNVRRFLGFQYPAKLNLGYGGLILEYYHNPMKIVHWSVSLLIGGGGISYREGEFMEHSSGDNDPDAFFALEPAVSGELNISKSIKLGINAGYRFITGANMYGIKNSDLNNFSAGLALKFGKF